MSSYWDAIDKERSIIQKSYESNTEIYDLAIFAWENSIVYNYFKDFHDNAAFLVMYKTQADVGLMRAITSVLKKEYSQAIYNIRYAAENLSIAIYAYAQPDELSEVFAKYKDPKADSNIKKAAHNFLKNNLPERSAKLRELHKTCDQFGSHQTLSHHSSHFSLDDIEKQFKISLHGSDKPEMSVGLSGIVAGLILEFHFAISALSEVEWVKVNAENRNTMNNVLQKLDEMKRKYMHLFIKAMM